MFKFSQEFNDMMPAHFGGYQGQPQPGAYRDVTSTGGNIDSSAPAPPRHGRPSVTAPYWNRWKASGTAMTWSTSIFPPAGITSIMVTYETDRGMLAEFIPEAFESTQSLLTVQYGMMRGVDWLAGGGYNLISVGVPVAYAQGWERIEGLYVLVIWENRTDPIVAGREQTGMPKIFADIEDHHQLGDRLLTNASYDGWTFVRMDFRQAKRMPSEELSLLNQRSGNVNAFGWRYIPNIGRPGGALSHATLFPQEFVYTAAWSGEGRVLWEALTPEQYPAHAPITQAPGRLPIKAYRDCVMAQSSMVLRNNDLARQLP